MTQVLVHVGVSNLLVSLAIAIIAWTVHRTGRHPMVAHVLWLLVLVKLVTPPILAVPVLPVHLLGPSTATTLPWFDAASASTLASDASRANDGIGASAGPAGVSSTASWPMPSLVAYGPTAVVLIWGLGSAVVLVWSLARIVRFNRLLEVASTVAPPDVQAAASSIARTLRLRNAPTIHTTSANISPMLWWTGGPVRVFIPAALSREMDSRQLGWILAHELAHVRRRDHLVRWLEWLACVGFWWNPVAWWARRNLRINEEICCDALVLARLRPEPRAYARSLMTVVEYLARPALRPPAVASKMSSGGFLEKRFTMIVSNNPISPAQRWVRASILVCAVGLLPLGLTSVDAAPPAGTAEKEWIDRGQDGELLDLLAELVATGSMDGKVAHELLVASEASRKRELVEAGTIEPEAFDRKMGLVLRLAVAEAKIERELIDGRITEEDARMRLEQMHKAMWDKSAKRLTPDDYARAEAKLDAMVEAGDISAEEARKKLAEMRKMVARAGEHDRRRMTRADYARVEAELEEMVAAGKISRADARKKLAEMRRMIAAQGAHHDDETIRRVAGALTEAGIPRERIRDVMGAMHRIAGQIRSEGDAFELDTGMQTYLEELGLDAEQIELVLGLSQRLAVADDDRKPARAERLHHDAEARVDWDAITKRIEGAVERGEITREEADEMYMAIKARLAIDGDH